MPFNLLIPFNVLVICQHRLLLDDTSGTDNYVVEWQEKYFFSYLDFNFWLNVSQPKFKINYIFMNWIENLILQLNGIKVALNLSFVKKYYI